MTTPSPSVAAREDARRFDDTRFVGWLLNARKDASIRAALRTADLPAAETRAYPALAPWWMDHPRLKEPILLVSASAARHHRIAQDKDVRLGRLVQRMSGQVLQHDSAQTRLLSIQKQDLRAAHHSIESLLAAADAAGMKKLNWFAFWRSYRYWSNPEAPGLYPARYRILEDFCTPTRPAN